MTAEWTEDMLEIARQEVSDLQDQVSKLEADLTQVRASHWELVQELGKAHCTIEELTDEIRAMERQIDRRTR